ncbi:MAG: O-antigen ligase domain-containing protein, partial [Planctomycetia bacterium]|nr:O-antigen ligase domain-containing protein [Planctomycetia bacterium]
MLGRQGTLSLTIPPPHAEAPRAGRVFKPAPAPAVAPRRWAWLNILGPTLLGYALLGRGWAYLGVAPVFIGELALLSGVVLLVASGDWRRTFAVPAAWALLALGTWGVFRTWPYVSLHGVDALRDAAVWGYGAFALLVGASLLAEPTRLPLLLRRYRRFTRVFLLVIPVVWLVRRFLGDSIPC